MLFNLKNKIKEGIKMKGKSLIKGKGLSLIISLGVMINLCGLAWAVPSPDSVTADPQPDGAINIIWKAVPGATGYKVYRIAANTPPAASETVTSWLDPKYLLKDVDAGGTSTAYLNTTGDSGFMPNTEQKRTTDGQHYYYLVAAQDSATATVSNGVYADASAPNQVTINAQPLAQTTTISLTWIAPGDGIGVDHYEIYRKISPEVLGMGDINSYLACSTESVTTGISTNLYQVTVTNKPIKTADGVTGVWLNQSGTGTNYFGSGDGQNGVSSYDPGTGIINLGLNLPAGTTQVYVTYQYIEYGTNSAGTYYDPGLAPATQYSYAVVAVDKAGNRSNVSYGSPGRAITPVLNVVAENSTSPGTSTVNLRWAELGSPATFTINYASLGSSYKINIYRQLGKLALILSDISDANIIATFTNTPANSYIDETVPMGTNAGYAVILVTQADTKSGLSNDSGTFTVDRAIPKTVLMVGPATATIYYAGNISVTAIAQDNPNGSGIDKMVFYWQPQGGSSVIIGTANTNIKGSETTPSNEIGTYTLSWDSKTVSDGTGSLYAVAYDVNGNATQTSNAPPWEITIDNTAPNVVLNPLVPDPNNNNRPTFTGTVTDTYSNVTAIEYRLGTETVGTWTSSGVTFTSGIVSTFSLTTGTLTDGTYTIEVRAKDNLGNTGTASQYGTDSFTIDTTVPNTELNPLVPDPNNDNTPTFTGTVTDTLTNVVAIEYRLGTKTGWTGWTGGAIFTPGLVATFSLTTGTLTDGTYTIEVRGRDAAGNTEDTPATGSFTIDTTGPVTELNPLVPNPHGTNTPTFTGTATDTYSNVTVIEYRIGTQTGWTDWGTTGVTFISGLVTTFSLTTGTLADGTYTIEVRGRDALNNTGMAVSGTFTIDTTGPNVSLNSLVPDPNNNNRPTFTGTVTDTYSNVTVIEYRLTTETGWLGGVTFTPGLVATFSLTTGGLADGTYTIEVRAQDSLGNTGTESQYGTDSFTIDTRVPNTELNPLVPDPNNDNTPTFTGTVTDTLTNVVAIEYRIGTGTVGTWTAVGVTFTSGLVATFSLTTGTLTDGTYTIEVRGRDAAGNTEDTPATGSFTIDTTGPVTELNPLVPNPHGINTPTFTGTVTDTYSNVTVIEYRLGTQTGWTDWGTTGVTFTSGLIATFSLTTGVLADGTYTIEVRGRDALNNTGTAVSKNFTIDTTGPDVVLNSLVPDPHNNNRPTFTGTATDTYSNVTVIEYRLGTETLGTWTSSGVTFTSGLVATFSLTTDVLVDGTYTIEVRAQDNLGNTGTASQYGTDSFTIDTTVPNTELNPLVPDPHGINRPTFTGTVTDSLTNVVAIEYRIGTETFGAWTGAGVTFTPGLVATFSLRTGTLTDGTYTIEVRGRDEAGNTEDTPATGSFTIDTTGPVTELNPLVPNPHGINTPTFTGTATDTYSNVTVIEYRLGTETVGAWTSTGVTFTAGLIATFSLTTGVLADGTYTIEVRGRDALNNTGTAVSKNFTIDTTGPDVVLNSLVPDPNNNNKPTFTGTATDTYSKVTVIEYRLGTETLGTWTSSGVTFTSGIVSTFSLTTGTLTDGTYTIEVRAKDNLGNTGTASQYGTDSFTIDTTVPNTELNPLVPDPHGINRPTFTGTVTDSLTNVVAIEYRIGTGTWTAVGVTFTSGLVATFSLTTGTLTDGTYTIEVRGRDEAGNTEDTPATDSFTIDTTGPVTELNPLVPNPHGINTPTFTGTATDTYSNVTVIEYRLGTETVGAWTSTGVTFTSGLIATFSLTTGVLADGTYTIEVRGRDALNNTGTAVSKNFTIDTTGPDVVLNSLIPDPGNNNRPTFTGTATDTYSKVTVIEYRLGTETLGTWTSTGVTFTSGLVATFSLTTDVLADGTYTIEVRAQDNLGNTGTASQYGTDSFTIDTTVPNTELNPLVPDPHGINRPTFTGTVTDTLTNVVAIEYRLGTGTWTAVGVTFTSGLVATFSLTTGTLTDGTYTIEVRGRDEAGNTEDTPGSDNFTIDTTGPVTQLNPLVPDPHGINTPTFTGTVTDTYSNVTVIEYRLGTETGWTDWTGGVTFTAGLIATFSLTTGVLADGTYTIEVRGRDALNNTGTAVSKNFTIDTTGPDVVLNSLVPDPHNNNTPTFTGTATDTYSPVGTIEYKVVGTSGTVIDWTSSGATFTPEPGLVVTFRLTTGTLPDGTYTIEVRGVDALGNISTPGQYGTDSFTIDTTPPTFTDFTAPGFKVGKGGPGTITFKQSEILPGTPTVRVDGNNGAINYLSYDNGTWTFLYNPAGADDQGTVTITVTGTDTAGNQGISTNSTVFVIDTQAPGIINIVANPAGAGSGTTVEITFTVSEGLLSIPTLTVNGHTATYKSGSLTAGGNFAYTYTVTNQDPSGYATITIVADDQAIPFNRATVTNTTALNVDNTPPSIGPITLTPPNDKTAIRDGDVVTVYGTASGTGSELQMATGTVKWFDITNTELGNLSITLFLSRESIPGDPFNYRVWGTYSVATYGLNAYNTKVEVKVTDVNGAFATADSETRRVDNIDPTSMTFGTSTNYVYPQAGTLTLTGLVNLQVTGVNDNTNGAGIWKVEFYFKVYPVGEVPNPIIRTLYPLPLGWIKIGEDTTGDNGTYSVSWDTTRLRGSNFWVKAIAIDNAGNFLDPPVGPFDILDTTPPTSITNITAEAIAGGHYIKLDWSHDTNAYDNIRIGTYTIYRQSSRDAYIAGLDAVAAYDVITPNLVFEQISLKAGDKVITSLKQPIVGVDGLWDNSAGAGINYYAGGNFNKDDVNLGTAVPMDGLYWIQYYQGKTVYEDKSPGPQGVNLYYVVRLMDGAGNKSGGNWGSFTITNAVQKYDVTGPDSIKDLRATNGTNTSINLIWTPPYDNVEVKEYRIYRKDTVVGVGTDTSKFEFTPADINNGNLLNTIPNNTMESHNQTLQTTVSSSSPWGPTGYKTDLSYLLVSNTTSIFDWTTNAPIPAGVSGINPYWRLSGNSIWLFNVTSGDDVLSHYTSKFESATYNDAKIEVLSDRTKKKVYAYMVVPVDTSGNVNASILPGTSTVRAVGSDTTKPDAMNTLIAQANPSTVTITLTWGPTPFDNVGVDHFNIYRDTKPVTFIDAALLVGTTSSLYSTTTNSYLTPATGSYTDRGIEGVTYYYALTAIDYAGNESGVSNGVFATVNDVTPPTITSFKINNDATYTKTGNVLLEVYGTDNITSSSKLQIDIANDSDSFAGNWALLSNPIQWTLSAQEGIRTVKIKLRDKANNPSEVKTATITLDTIAPTNCSVSINNGATYATMTAVNLTLSATDANKMLIANNPEFAGAVERDYSTTGTWTLPAGDGVKYVYVRFIDLAGNYTDVSDSIILDTVGGTGVSIEINNGDKYTDTRNVTLKLYAEDISEMMLSEDKNFMSGNWISYSPSATFTLTVNDGEKTVYVKFKDAAGNETSIAQDSIILDTTPATVNVTYAPTSSTTGEDVKVYAEISDTVGFDSAKLYYVPIGYYQQTLDFMTGTATIPVAIDKVGTITYYIEVKDMVGHVTRKPDTPGTYYELVVTDNDAPVITYINVNGSDWDKSQNPVEVSSLYPIQFKVGFTDNIGVSTAEVEYFETDVDGTGTGTISIRSGELFSLGPISDDLLTIVGTITVKDAQGNSTVSSPIEIRVDDKTPPIIQKVTGNADVTTGESIEISAVIKEGRGTPTVILYSTTGTQTMNLVKTNWNEYYATATITAPLNSVNPIYYSIEAIDSEFNKSLSPGDGRYIITVKDNDSPVITMTATPLTNTTGERVTVSGTITDNVGVDSQLLYYAPTQAISNHQTSPIDFSTGQAILIAATDFVGTVTYYIEAKDAQGNTTKSGSFTMTITDNDNPVITLNESNPPTAVSGEVITLKAVLTDNVGVTKGNITYTPQGAFTTLSPIDLGSNLGNLHEVVQSLQVSATFTGTINGTFTINDAQGNTDAKPFQIVVSDKTAPVISETTNIPQTGGTGDEMKITCNVTDNTAVATVTLYYTQLSSGAQSLNMTKNGSIYTGTFTIDSNKTGVIPYYIVAIDTAGNTSRDKESGNYEITVRDDDSPVITMTATPLINTTGESVTVSGNITDNVGVDSSLLYYSPVNAISNHETSPIDFSSGQAILTAKSDFVGSVIYYIEAKDAQGNTTKSGSFTMTITDNDNPVITLNKSNPTTAVSGEGITLQADLTDNVGVTKGTITYTPQGAFTTLSPIDLGSNLGNLDKVAENLQVSLTFTGTINGTFTINDAQGNTDAKPFQIVVSDKTAPVISETTNIPQTGETGDEMEITCKVTDNTAVGTVTLYYTQLSSGVQSLNMTKNGSIYTGTFTIDSNKTGVIPYYIVAIDTAGNTSRDKESGNYEITVRDDDSPVITMTATPLINTTGESVTVSGTITDNVGLVSQLLYYAPTQAISNHQTSPIDFSTGEAILTAATDFVGTVTYHVEAKDAEGNITTSATYIMTITDNDNPLITLNQSNPTTAISGGQITLQADLTDNVGVTKGTITYTPQGAFTTLSPIDLGSNLGNLDKVAENLQVSAIFTGTINGTFTINDAQGNTDAKPFQIVVSDKTAPAISETTNIPQTGETGDEMEITCKVTDNTAVGTVTLYYTQLSSGAQSLNMTKNGSIYTGTFTIDSNKTGVIPYYIVAIDTAGNTSRDKESGNYEITVRDDDSPVITMTATPLINTTGESVTVSGNITDNVGVDSSLLYYSPVNAISNHETSPIDFSSGQAILTAKSDFVGSVIYYIEAKDAQGNTTKSGSFTMTITDNDNPVITLNESNPPTAVSGEVITLKAVLTDNVGVTKGNITYIPQGAFTTLSPIDLGSNLGNRHEVSQVLQVSATFTGTINGTFTINDAQGNTDAKPFQIVVSDKTAPEISETTNIPQTGETGDEMEITCKVTDNTAVGTVTLYYTQLSSGVQSLNMTKNGSIYTGTFTIDSNKTGVIPYYIVARDTAGNTSRDPESGAYFITVGDDDQPVAAFTPSTQTVGQGVPATFNAGSSTDNVGVVSYSWNFGDGNSKEDVPYATIDHPYVEIGVYTVKLTVKDAAGLIGTTQGTVTVTDTTPPVARIKGGNKVVPEHTAVDFDGSESSDNVGISKYIWNFGNGVEISTSTPVISYTYPNPGVYATVTLKVVDNANNTSTLTLVDVNLIQVTVLYVQLPATQTTIGPAGGTIGAEQDITLNIPNGALGQNTVLKIEPSTLGDVPNEWVGIAKTTYIITPKKLFNKQGTLTIWYADANKDGVTDNCDLDNLQTTGIDANNLAIYYYDGYDWIMLPSTVNITSNSVSAQITNSGKFTLGVKGQGPASKEVDPDTILANLVLTKNPFAPTGGNFTEFQGDLGRDSYITVKIYDTTGEEVRELPKMLVTAGASRLLAVWDGKTDGGEITENGIYVYQIKVEQQVGGGTKVETHAIGIVK